MSTGDRVISQASGVAVGAQTDRTADGSEFRVINGNGIVVGSPIEQSAVQRQVVRAAHGKATVKCDAIRDCPACNVPLLMVKTPLIWEAFVMVRVPSERVVPRT